MPRSMTCATAPRYLMCPTGRSRGMIELVYPFKPPVTPDSEPVPQECRPIKGRVRGEGAQAGRACSLCEVRSDPGDEGGQLTSVDTDRKPLASKHGTCGEENPSGGKWFVLADGPAVADFHIWEMPLGSAWRSVGSHEVGPAQDAGREDWRGGHLRHLPQVQGAPVTPYLGGIAAPGLLRGLSSPAHLAEVLRVGGLQAGRDAWLKRPCGDHSGL